MTSNLPFLLVFEVGAILPSSVSAACCPPLAPWTKAASRAAHRALAAAHSLFRVNDEAAEVWRLCRSLTASTRLEAMVRLANLATVARGEDDDDVEDEGENSDMFVDSRLRTKRPRGPRPSRKKAKKVGRYPDLGFVFLGNNLSFFLAVSQGHQLIRIS